MTDLASIWDRRLNIILQTDNVKSRRLLRFVFLSLLLAFVALQEAVWIPWLQCPILCTDNENLSNFASRNNSIWEFRTFFDPRIRWMIINFDQGAGCSHCQISNFPVSFHVNSWFFESNLKLSISLCQFCLKRGQNKFNTISNSNQRNSIYHGKRRFQHLQ